MRIELKEFILLVHIAQSKFKFHENGCKIAPKTMFFEFFKFSRIQQKSSKINFTICFDCGNFSTCFFDLRWFRLNRRVSVQSFFRQQVEMADEHFFRARFDQIKINFLPTHFRGHLTLRNLRKTLIYLDQNTCKTCDNQG